MLQSTRRERYALTVLGGNWSTLQPGTLQLSFFPTAQDCTTVNSVLRRGSPSWQTGMIGGGSHMLES